MTSVTGAISMMIVTLSSTGDAMAVMTMSMTISRKGLPRDRFAAHTIAEAAARVLVSLSGSVEYTIGTSTVTAVVSRCVVGVVTDTTDAALAPPRPYSRFDAVLTAHPQPNTGS